MLLLLLSLLLSTQVLGGYKSYYDDYYKKKATPAPTTPSPTTASPTAPLDDEEKCGCYSIEKTLQEEIGDEICYSYTITRVCDDNYYQQKIDYIAFDADKDLGLEEECCDESYYGYNGGDCEIVTQSECKTVSQTYSNKVNGIKCEFDDDSYSGGGSTTKKSDDDDDKSYNDDDDKSYNDDDDKSYNDDDDKSYNDDDDNKTDDDKYYRRRLRTSYNRNRRQR